MPVLFMLFYCLKDLHVEGAIWKCSEIKYEDAEVLFTNMDE